MRFVDTNVLLYAISGHPADAAKAERAVALLNEPDLALSVQVLQEFYVQATRDTASARVSHSAAVALITTLLRFPVQEMTLSLFEQALRAKVRWQLSYWDAAIVVAAAMLGCHSLLTEDLQDGQSFDGLVVVNPFR